MTDADPIEALSRNLRHQVEPSRERMDQAAAVLRLWLARRGLTPEERDEVCSEALERLVVCVREGRLDVNRPAGAWLRVVADHLAIDALRRRGRHGHEPYDEDSHAGAGEDERLAGLLDASAAAQDVLETLRQAADEGEHELVRVISTWLSLAELNGEAPTSREVGARLGVSHMTAQRALKVFGERLSERLPRRDVPTMRPSA